MMIFAINYYYCYAHPLLFCTHNDRTVLEKIDGTKTAREIILAIVLFNIPSDCWAPDTDMKKSRPVYEDGSGDG